LTFLFPLLSFSRRQPVSPTPSPPFHSRLTFDCGVCWWSFFRGFFVFFFLVSATSLFLSSFDVRCFSLGFITFTRFLSFFPPPDTSLSLTFYVLIIPPCRPPFLLGFRRFPLVNFSFPIIQVFLRTSFHLSGSFFLFLILFLARVLFFLLAKLLVSLFSLPKGSRSSL